MEILCGCGHLLERHDAVSGCEFGWTGKSDNETPCMCEMSPALVEALYWWYVYKKEVYKLRERLINDDECPNCEGHLQREELGLPDDTTSFCYRCCSCNKVWSYYGKDLTEEK